MSKNGRALSFWRWLDISFIALSSYGIINLLLHSNWIAEKYTQWSQLITSTAWYSQAIVGSIGFYCIYKILRDFKVFNPSHKKSISLQFKYPPLYFSVLIAIFIFYITTNHTLPEILTLNIFILLCVYLATCYFLYLHQQYSFPNNLCKNLPTPKDYNLTKHEEKFFEHLNNINRGDLKDIYLWIKEEKPIDNDQFNRKIYSERIKNHILKKENKANHIAILGEFGSGKSSIFKAIKIKIEKESNDFIFIEIDGWGRSDKSCAAQILEEIVDSLSEHIDCSPIKNIPKNYLDALSGIRLKGTKAFSGFLQSNYQSPQKTLKKINDILSSINKRIIVVLEDFDRRKNADEAINEIASLLDRLRGLDKIDFILNIGNQSQNDILSRVCTYREDLGDISNKAFLKKFYALLIEHEKFKNGFSLNEDQSLSPFVFDKIDSIIKTPRNLKNVLRRVYISWESLAGEIDLYDLLILNTIRYVEPLAFDFISTKIDQLRSVSNNADVAKLWHGNPTIPSDSLKSIPNQKIGCINELISYLFPNANEKSKRSSQESLKNQRVAYLGETDFFKRVLEENVSENSDVAYINRIVSINKKATTEAAESFLEEASNNNFLMEKIVQFYWRPLPENQNVILSSENLHKLFFKKIRQEISTRGFFNEDYFREIKINFLIKNIYERPIKIYVEEISKHLCSLNLQSFLLFYQKIRRSNTDIDFQLIVIESLENIDVFRDSLAKSSPETILNICREVLDPSTEERVNNFLSLFISTFEKYPDDLVYDMIYLMTNLRDGQNPLHISLLPHKDKLAKIFINSQFSNASEDLIQWIESAKNNFKSI